jgi:ABC-type transporter Mla subunit MlaD
VEPFWIEFGAYAGGLCLVCGLILLVFRAGANRERRLFLKLDDQPDLRTAPATPGTWLAWVNRCFPPRKVGVPRWTRDDAVKEFDARMLSRFSFQALQRFAVAAPVCGVFITMLKFVFYQPPALTNPGLPDILRTVAGPLFLGVGSGATAALWCQLCLLWANRSLVGARLAALGWFDEAVWADIDPGNVTPVMQEMLRGMKQFSKDLQDTSGEYRKGMKEFDADLKTIALKHREAADTLNRALVSIQTASDGFTDLVTKTAANLKALPAEISRAVAGITNVCGPLDQIGQKVPGLIAALNQVVGAAGRFNDAVLKELTPASGQFARSAGQVESWAKQLTAQQTDATQASSDLKKAVQKLEQEVARQAKGIDDFNKGAEQIREAAGRIDGVSQGLQAFEKKGIRQVQDSFQKLDEILLPLQGSAEALAKLLNMQPQLQSLLKSLEEATRVAGAIRDLPAQIQSGLDAAQKGLATVARDAGTATGKELHGVLDKQLEMLKETQAAMDGIPKQLEDALKGASVQLERFAKAMLVEQIHDLEPLLRGIARRMNEAPTA